MFLHLNAQLSLVGKKLIQPLPIYVEKIALQTILLSHLFAVPCDVEALADELGGQGRVAVLPLHVELGRGHGEVVLRPKLGFSFGPGLSGKKLAQCRIRVIIKKCFLCVAF
jgi:hypothetical protein